MRYFIYNFFLGALIIFGFPIFLLDLALRPRHRAGFGQKLGFLPKALLDGVKDKPVIWLHAVSVGEVNSLLPLVDGLIPRYPQAQLIVSVTTATGYAFAKQKFQGRALVCYFPYDLPWITRKVIRQLHPQLVIVAEKEFWPNFLNGLKKFEIPVLWVNAKVSDHSYVRYRFWKGFFKEVFSGVSSFAAESEPSRQRLLGLGVAPEKILVTGHTKIDQALAGSDPGLEWKLKQILPAIKTRPVFLAASTHEGEEEIICRVFREVKQEKQNLLLILVPRHPERFERVARLLKKNDFNFIRSSQLNGSGEFKDPAAILVDEIGILASLYAHAHVAFIGGSLVPAGGHNVWEAAVHGIPVLYGDYMRHDYGLSEAGGAIRVRDSRGLLQALRTLLNSSEQKEELARRMKEFIRGHQGAVQQDLKLVETLFS